MQWIGGSLLQNTFAFQILELRRCATCKKISRIFDSSTTLFLSLASSVQNTGQDPPTAITSSAHQDLNTLLDSRFKERPIDVHNCGFCFGKDDTQRSRACSFICRCPPVFVFKLMRYGWDIKTQKGTKDSTMMVFPLHINMKKYLYPAVVASTTSYVYNLVAVVSHFGSESLYSGHYKCFVVEGNTSNGHGKSYHLTNHTLLIS